MAIPYRTAKVKSTNILSIAILGSTAKFNSRQYFRLYGISRMCISNSQRKYRDHTSTWYSKIDNGRYKEPPPQFCPVLAGKGGGGGGVVVGFYSSTCTFHNVDPVEYNTVIRTAFYFVVL